MRINARPTDLMADNEAQTGVGTRGGSTLDPKRMTAKERAAARKNIAATTKKLAPLPKTTAAEKDISAITKESLAAEAANVNKNITDIAAQAEADLKAGQIAENTARIAQGEKIFTGNTLGTGASAEEIQQMLADFYAKLQGDALSQKRQVAESAYSLLFDEFSRYGLGSLVEPLRKYVEEGISPAEFTIRLRNEPAYKKRFAANESRIQKGLRALSEAEYIGLEDQYQDIMRRYGMPETYYKQEKDPVTGIMLQPGFEKLIAGDVSAVELEDRVQTAYDRVINANPQIVEQIRNFYGDTITNGDILAYALDPKNAINNIKRKVTAAEIGAGAVMAGLGTTRARAEELGALGVTAQQAREGFQTIGSFLPRATQLGDIYSKQGMGPFTQTTAEEEVFGTTGAVEAQRKRRKLAELETAQFSGQAGIAQGALARERAGQF